MKAISVPVSFVQNSLKPAEADKFLSDFSFFRQNPSCF